MAPVRLLLAMAVWLSFTAAASSQPMRSPDWSNIISRSDLIAVGYIMRNQSASGGRNDAPFHLRVDRVFKGDVRSGKTLEFFRVDPAIAPVSIPTVVDVDTSENMSGPVSAGDCGVFFLRALPAGGYMPVDNMYPDLILSCRPAPPGLKATDTVESAVSKELAWNFTTPVSQVPTPKMMEYDASVGHFVTSPSIELYRESYYSLGYFPQEVARQAVREALPMTREPIAQGWIVAFLLRRPNLDMSLLKLIHAEAFMPRPLPGFPYQQIGGKLTGYDTQPYGRSPAGRQILLDLLHSPDPDLRYGAASALGSTQLPEDLRVLARVIGDPDQRVRAQAAMALCEFIESCAGEGVEYYIRPENHAAFASLLEQHHLIP